MDCPALVPAIVKCIGVQPREHRSSAWQTVGGKEQQQVPSAPEFTMLYNCFPYKRCDWNFNSTATAHLSSRSLAGKPRFHYLLQEKYALHVFFFPYFLNIMAILKKCIYLKAEKFPQTQAEKEMPPLAANGRHYRATLFKIILTRGKAVSLSVTYFWACTHLKHLGYLLPLEKSGTYAEKIAHYSIIRC